MNKNLSRFIIIFIICSLLVGAYFVFKFVKGGQDVLTAIKTLIRNITTTILDLFLLAINPWAWFKVIYNFGYFLGDLVSGVQVGIAWDDFQQRNYDIVFGSSINNSTGVSFPQ